MGLSTVAVFKNIDTNQSGLIELDDEKLHDLQSVLFDVLCDFDEVCRKHNIEYSLGGGSALGLVRHGGFIPWDDDVDLNITRENYEKLKAVFDEELSDRYWLHTPEKTKEYGLAFPRLRKKGTVCRAREDDSTSEAGVYIDLFVIENTYSFKPMYYLHGFFSMLFGFTLSCRVFYKKREFYIKLANGNKEILKVFKKKITIGKLLSFMSVDKWTHIWNSANKMCKNRNSSRVTIPTGRKHFFKETYLRSEVCEMERKPFKFDDRQHDVYLVKASDEYLKRLYGDYMQIPPVEKREKHVLLEFDLGKGN